MTLLESSWLGIDGNFLPFHVLLLRTAF